MLKYEWPERFEYIVKLDGRNCVAIKNTAGLYNCYECSERRLDSTIIDYRSAADFESALGDGRINVLTPLKRVSA